MSVTTAPTQNKVELGLLEEDDEFEEFEVEDWNDIDKDGDNEQEVNLWEDNWDDDIIEDDFTMQLR
jgi:26 proteasome complex subunit DSS1